MSSKAILTAAALALCLGAPLAQAGAIGNACKNSDRGRGNPALCGCIDQIAQQTLSRSDQRRAAKFFRDADRAQQVRMSKSRTDNAFWDRYKRFTGTAQRYCR